MKATCPKCGGALRLTDWKPNCPHCGVNMLDYAMHTDLSADADAAELEFSRIQPVIDRIKASYIGSRKVKIRIAVSLLPIAALFLPLVKFRYMATYAENDRTYQVISLVQTIIERAKSDTPFAVPGNTLSPICAALAALSVVCLALSLLTLIVHLVLLGGSCTEKGQRRLYACDTFLLLFGFCSLCTFLAFASATGTVLPHIFYKITPGIGAFLFLLLLLGVLITDIAVIRSGIKVQYTPCYVGAVPAEEFRTLLEQGYTATQIHARYAAAPEEAAERLAGIL